MANWYVSSVAYAAVATWVANNVTAIGDYVRPTAPAVGNERVFKCTARNTDFKTGAVEPSWNNAANGTTTDNHVTWTEVTGKESEQVAGNWKAPAARIANLTISSKVATGDTLYLSSDHAETQTTAWNAWTLGTFLNGHIMSVSRGGGSSMPPVAADYLAGASIAATGASSITLTPASQSSTFHVRGVTISAGNSSNLASIQITGATTSNGALTILEDCTLVINNTNAASRVAVGGAGGTDQCAELRNTTVNFGAAGQAISLAEGTLAWINTPNAVQGTAPTSLFVIAVSRLSLVKIAGCDLSGASAALFSNVTTWAAFEAVIRNCKLASGVAVVSGSPVTPLNNGSPGKITIENCDDTSNNRNYRAAYYLGGGNVITESGVIRTGGASDGVTGYSLKATTSASMRFVAPLNLPIIARRWNATGAVTATIYFIANTAAALTDAQIWADIEALTDSASPQATFASGAAANFLSGGTAHGADTSAWNGNLAVRANSTAYALGDAFTVASAAAGVVWFCTTAGTTAGSEPGGYAGAADGASVTDGGTAVFRAGRRQKLTVTFTPQKRGMVYAQVRLAASSITVFVDPKLQIA